MALEYSQYLENYLWRHFTPDCTSPAHLLSIVLMVNEKWRQGVPPWQAFVNKPEHMARFLHLVMDAATGLYEVSVIMGLACDL